jgi:photosystem II stability/assembly factor-like uncharacterized protein
MHRISLRPRRIRVPAAALLIGLCLAAAATEAPRPGVQGEGGGPYPSDWFGMQRAFPGDRIDQEKLRVAVEQALVDRAAGRLTTNSPGLVWQQAGPYNIGGRVTALAVAPGGNTIYLASANGGLFKSTNAGGNWSPIFDNGAVYSMGALALEPGNPSVIYCGTGEANASVDSYDGTGLYRSTDAGQSWLHLGLTETARIGRVAVDPSNPSRIYVAAMGTQFSTGPHRGLYRSENGGQSWSKVLFMNDSTGVCDVVINPAHPETVFAATWERVRRATYRRAYGPGCGIWRSTNSGTTWTRLSAGLPTPSDDVGRIGLAIAASRPSWVYAQIITGAGLGYNGLGMYRTTDGGNTWARRDASGYTGAYGGFGWYFGDVAVDPTNPDRVFGLGQFLIRSTNGGVDFTDVTGSAHVDEHAFWIDPAAPNRIYMGSDGGFFSTLDGAGTPPGWSRSTDLPITQFYAGTIDPSNPARLLGGTQDNNTLITGGSPSAWSPILGGDGFQCLVDPVNPNTLFAEFQYCCKISSPPSAGLRRSTNGGGGFAIPGGFNASDRYNWNTPIAMSPLDHNVLLVGSQRVYKSTDNGVSYSIVSGDLTTNNTSSLLVYSTLTALDISAADAAVYWAGSDDGRVHRSTNAGGSWLDVSAGLPVRWVTRVTADPANRQVAYVTLSGFGMDEHLAHVYRTTDLGATWAPIAGNLPDVPANDVLVDPADPSRLFLATDVGVYTTENLGVSWYPLGVALPLQAVFDLTFHAASRTLVAATHGRSQWKLDVSDLPVAVGPSQPPRRMALSAPRPNPARGAIECVLKLPEAARVRVAVFDASGRRIVELLDAALPAGDHAVRWAGRDRRGRPTAAGAYFVRAEVAGGAVQTRRFIRLD